MSYLEDFLNRIHWWRLEPSNELIQNQSTDWANYMVFAKSLERDLAVAYLPNNPCIKLDLSNFPKPLKATWFHPTENRYEDHPNHISSNSYFEFNRPHGWIEAILLLDKITS
jgi:hypothetical protein